MKTTVLFVDDEAAILDGIRDALRREPLEIHTANSGTEALALLASRKIDVVVSDERMPGMSGSEFLTRVRRDHPGTVRTAYVGQRVRQRVEVVADPVGEGEGLLADVEEPGLVLDLPGVEPDEPPTRMLRCVLDRVHVGRAGPVVDAGVGVPGQQPRQSAHGAILTKDS